MSEKCVHWYVRKWGAISNIAEMAFKQEQIITRQKNENLAQSFNVYQRKIQRICRLSCTAKSAKNTEEKTFCYHFESLTMKSF